MSYLLDTNLMSESRLHTPDSRVTDWLPPQPPTAATDFLVKNGFDEAYGARPLKRSIQKWIEDPLSEKILLAEFSKGDEIDVDVSADGSRLDFRVLATSPKA